MIDGQGNLPVSISEEEFLMFSYDSPVIRFLNKVADLLILNFIFLVSCLPVVTIGAAISGLYAVSLHSVRFGDGYVWKNYFKAFRHSFKQATLGWLIMLLILAVLVMDILFWRQVDMGSLNSVMLGISYVILFFWLSLESWFFPLIAKMKDPLSVQFRNAAKMCIGYLIPYTLFIAGIKLLLGYISFINTPMLFVMLLIGFSTQAYICSFFIYKVFSGHITEESLGYDDLLYRPDEPSRRSEDQRTILNENTFMKKEEGSES